VLTYNDPNVFTGVFGSFIAVSLLAAAAFIAWLVERYRRRRLSSLEQAG
jgi:hypothetical protein